MTGQKSPVVLREKARQLRNLGKFYIVLFLTLLGVFCARWHFQQTVHFILDCATPCHPKDKTAAQPLIEQVFGDRGWSWADPQTHDLISEGIFRLKKEDFARWRDQPMALLARYCRAFRERHLNSAVYYLQQLPPTKTDLVNLKYLRQELTQRGFILNSPCLRPIVIEQSRWLWLRRVVSFLLSLWPLILFIPQWRDPYAAFLTTLFFGICVWFVLQTDVFRYQLESLYFIQFSFAIPFLFLVFFNVKFQIHRFFIFLALLFVVVAIGRSGQWLPTLPGEFFIRDWLDVYVGFRPRFKELVGWIFWFLVFFLTPHRSHRDSLRSLIALSFFPFALFGPVTTMNSFLHAHSPLLFLIERSLLTFCCAFFIVYCCQIFSTKLGDTILNSPIY